jgi:biopolymer transport protein ExbD
MAEVTTASTGNKPGGRRSKKLSTRVDLTPMVDLGFLLITFFIFTNTMSKPKAMKLIMPDDTRPAPPSELAESAALTILPLADNKVFYYHGSMALALQKGAYGIVNYSFKDGIGQVIRDKQLAMDKSGKVPRKDLMLLVKPTTEANYQNIIDILDEVRINDVSHYAILDISGEEKNMLKEKKATL